MAGFTEQTELKEEYSLQLTLRNLIQKRKLNQKTFANKSIDFLVL